jgi:hypothetical protein
MGRNKGDSAKVAEAPPREGGEMSVSLRGTPEEVRAHLNAPAAPESETQHEPPGAPASPETLSPQKSAYIEALKVPQNTVVVKRISPRNWNDQKVNVEVYREQCPLDPVGIEEEIRNDHGGRKYRVAVINSETGQVVAADTFEVDADPLVTRSPEEEELEREMMMQGTPQVADLNEAMLERQTRLTAKQTEYEMARQQLESLKNQQANSAKVDPRVDARIRELEQRTLEQQADRRVAEAEARHQREMDDLKRQAAPPKPQGLDDPLIRMMMEQNKQANERFEKLLTQMNDNRMADIQRQLAEVKSKPAGNNLLEMADSMLKLKEVFGWGGPGEGDDGDDDDDDGEGKPFLERLADKYLPKVFDMIEDEQNKTGKELSKDEVVARINSAADQAVREEMAKRAAAAQQRSQTAPGIQHSPQSAPQAAAAPAAAPAQPAAAAAAPAAPPERQIPSIDEEIRIRVGSVLGILERELALRPRGWQWTLAAWQALPEDLREKISVRGLSAETAIRVLEPHANPQGIELMVQRVGDPKVKAWFERGLAELRGWGESLAKDPDFDPAADEGEDEEV